MIGSSISKTVGLPRSRRGTQRPALRSGGPRRVVAAAGPSSGPAGEPVLFTFGDGASGSSGGNGKQEPLLPPAPAEPLLPPAPAEALLPAAPEEPLLPAAPEELLLPPAPERPAEALLPPAPEEPLLPPPPQPAAAAGAVAAAKLALLEFVAPLNRGALATPADRERADALARALEAAAASASSTSAAADPTQLLDGRWELAYASTEAFRNSPFFAAFSNVVSGLTGDSGAVADAIFAFTDAIPNATVGPAYQTVDLAAGVLTSEVDLYVFPGLRGTVVTTSRAEPEPVGAAAAGAGGGAGAPVARLALAVESTRVERSNFSPFLDAVSVPVERLIEQVRGPAAARVTYDVTFADESLRVTRCGRQLLVHRRA